MTALDRFMRMVAVHGECWLWQGRLTRGGYGQFHYQGKTWRAHKAAWVLFRGKLRKDRVLLHTCDTPQCVNPAHLKPGTQKANVRDMVRKGRAWWQKGKHGIHSAKRTAGASAGPQHCG